MSDRTASRFVLKLDRNTELARAVSIMLAEQRDLLLMIEVNKLDIFSSRFVINEIEKMFSLYILSYGLTLMKVWEKSKKLWKYSLLLGVHIAFLVLPVHVFYF